MSAVLTKFRPARLRHVADADDLLPPPLPLIHIPDEARQTLSGGYAGRPQLLPVRRHHVPASRNMPPEPNLHENRTELAAEAHHDAITRPVMERICVYEYNQPEVFAHCEAPEDTLIFDSLFECGNLLRAERVIRENVETSAAWHEYELMIHPDLKNSAYRQWFYFEVQNASPGIEYRFSLVNLAKSGALFGDGLQPVVYSECEAQQSQRSWVHAGTHVRYDTSDSPSSPGTSALSFRYEFTHANDRVYFACLQPYSYTDLIEYLDELDRDPARSVFVRRTELCQTIALNTCDLLSITSPSKEGGLAHEDKKVIVLSARVHPGEPNASWMMKGMLDFLTGSSASAAVLRARFVFKVVPMLNPDGVINGNTRVNLAGWDLNRKWANPVDKLFPTVFYLKKLLAHLQSRDRVAIYCDLHGHSINRNIFTYGCYQKRNNKKHNAAVVAAVQAASTATASPPSFEAAVTGASLSRQSIDCNSAGASTEPALIAVTAPSSAPPTLLTRAPAAHASVRNDPRVFPMIVARHSEFFSFQHCDFKVHKSKLNTARVVVNHELGVINSYTLEASFCGPDKGVRRDTQFSTWDLEEMGRSWCQSLLVYFGLLPLVRRHEQMQQQNQKQQDQQKQKQQQQEQERDQQLDLEEDNLDLLSDNEAALSELFASVELLDEEDPDDGMRHDELCMGNGGVESGGGGGRRRAGGGSQDSDISGAEDAIPPNQEDELVESMKRNASRGEIEAATMVTVAAKAIARRTKTTRKKTKKHSPGEDGECGAGVEPRKAKHKRGVSNGKGKPSKRHHKVTPADQVVQEDVDGKQRHKEEEDEEEDGEGEGEDEGEGVEEDGHKITDENARGSLVGGGKDGDDDHDNDIDNDNDNDGDDEGDEEEGDDAGEEIDATMGANPGSGTDTQTYEGAISSRARSADDRHRNAGKKTGERRGSMSKPGKSAGGRHKKKKKKKPVGDATRAVVKAKEAETETVSGSAQVLSQRCDQRRCSSTTDSPNTFVSVGSDRLTALVFPEVPTHLRRTPPSSGQDDEVSGSYRLRGGEKDWEQQQQRHERGFRSEAQYSKRMLKPGGLGSSNVQDGMLPLVHATATVMASPERQDAGEEQQNTDASDRDSGDSVEH